MKSFPIRSALAFSRSAALRRSAARSPVLRAGSGRSAPGRGSARSSRADSTGICGCPVFAAVFVDERLDVRPVVPAFFLEPADVPRFFVLLVVLLVDLLVLVDVESP